MSNPLSRILDWLHEGYPEGVPPKDYYPLLALLTRTLHDEELREIVATVIRENPDGDISTDDVQGTIEKVKNAPIARADVQDVAARLAAVGWPLADLDEAERRFRQERAAQRTAQGADGIVADPTGADGASPGSSVAPSAAEDGPDAPGLRQRIDEWLSAGYPQGVPRQDRVPLLALLRRRLTDEEVEQIAHRLASRADDGREPISSVDARALIMQTTDEVPSPQDLERVAARLAARGWPLEG